MAALTVNSMPRGGIDNTAGFVAASGGGDTIAGAGTGRIFLQVKNTNAATRDVTIVDPRLTDIGLAHPDTVVTIPATTGDTTIPIYAQYVNSVTGLVDITYSAVTNLTVKAVSH